MRWVRLFGTIEAAKGKQVESIEVRWVVEDAEGTVWVTDTQLQDGRIPTGHVPNTQEILEREHDPDTGQAVRYRHFNAVIRGQKMIAVPNRAEVEKEADLRLRVPGGADFTFWPSQDLPGGALRFAHQYRTRQFILHEALKAGDEFRFWSSRLEVSINGVRTRSYTGFYHICPPGFGRFHVEMVDPSTGKPLGSGYLLVEVDTWLRGIGGRRM